MGFGVKQIGRDIRGLVYTETNTVTRRHLGPWWYERVAPIGKAAGQTEHQRSREHFASQPHVDITESTNSRFCAESSRKAWKNSTGSKGFQIHIMNYHEILWDIMRQDMNLSIESTLWNLTCTVWKSVAKVTRMMTSVVPVAAKKTSNQFHVDCATKRCKCSAQCGQMEASSCIVQRPWKHIRAAKKEKQF